MRQPVAILDLFSGPGGLAEGFVARHDPATQDRYQIALSVEKNLYAYRTLRLREFLRQFPRNFPSEYYAYLNAEITEPNWATLYPSEWNNANNKTAHLELGGDQATSRLQKTIRGLHKKHGGRTVLIGGPPCQSYSIARRNTPYDVANSSNYEKIEKTLYQQFVKAIAMLEPAIAIMENVTGILSSKIDGQPIMPTILARLRSPASGLEYRLRALSLSSAKSPKAADLSPQDFIVRAENYGIPQARHRVFIVCLRSDIADDLPHEYEPKLEPRQQTVNINDIISEMPKLRSGLSRADTYTEWRKTISSACKLVEQNLPQLSNCELQNFRRSLSSALESSNGYKFLTRKATGGTSLPASCPPELRDWIFDKHLKQLPNNETRGHMPSDLARYLFAAVFGETVNRSPRTSEFPHVLVPDHNSWSSGNFADRYRVQLGKHTSSTITSHISKDGHHFIHPDPSQCRSLTVREVARLQTFPDNYLFLGGRTQQYIQVGNAVPPFLAHQIANSVWNVIEYQDQLQSRKNRPPAGTVVHKRTLSKASSPRCLT